MVRNLPFNAGHGVEAGKLAGEFESKSQLRELLKIVYILMHFTRG